MRPPLVVPKLSPKNKQQLVQLIERRKGLVGSQNPEGFRCTLSTKRDATATSVASRHGQVVEKLPLESYPVTASNSYCLIPERVPSECHMGTSYEACEYTTRSPHKHPGLLLVAAATSIASAVAAAASASSSSSFDSLPQPSRSGPTLASVVAPAGGALNLIEASRQETAAAAVSSQRLLDRRTMDCVRRGL